MALFTGVRHNLVGGHDGPMSAHLGFVLHVNQSNGNLDNWVANQNNDMSCHFEVYKNGTATQYVDTAFSSWCQMAGNSTYLSIETEGYDYEALTPAQVDRIANIVAQGHLVHGIPLVLAENPGDRGLGWHGMGGAAWGGHTGCPGNKRKAQRKDILAKAAALVAPAKPSPAPKPANAVLPRTPGDNRLVSAPDGHAVLALRDDGHGYWQLGDGPVRVIDFSKLGSAQ